MQNITNLLYTSEDTQPIQSQEFLEFSEPLSAKFKEEDTDQSPTITCKQRNLTKENEYNSLSETASTGVSTQASNEASLDVLSKEEAKRKKELKNLSVWRGQLRYGDFVKGTKILPIKTFLCEPEWLDLIHETEHHNLIDLAENFDKQGLKIGMILDLNRSTHYYNFDKARGDHPLLAHTKYYKFKLEQGAVPTEESIEEVYKIFEQGHETEDIILVHCYNGINRTGYMVCEFLCKKFGLSGEEAIKNFEEARKYRMEHACLTSTLLEKYPEAKQE